MRDKRTPKDVCGEANIYVKPYICLVLFFSLVVVVYLLFRYCFYMCILYCCEGRKLDNYWVITSPSLNKEYCIVLYCTRVRRVRRIEDNLTINDFRLLTIADSTTSPTTTTTTTTSTTTSTAASSTTTTATTTITGLWAVAFHVVVPFTRLFAIPRVFPAAAMTGFVCTR